MSGRRQIQIWLLPCIMTMFVGIDRLIAADASSGSTIRVVVEAPTPGTTDRVYVTLWKAVELYDEVRIVLQPNGLGLYDRVFWRERATNTIWIRHRNALGSIGENTKFINLEPGKYRVTVNNYDAKSSRPDPTPFGLSHPVLLSSASAELVRVSLGGTTPLTVRVLDAASKSPLKRTNIRLRSSNGMPIVHGHGSGNFFERTDASGEVHYSKLLPGTYFVEVLGRGSTVSNLVEYGPLPHDITVKIPSSDTRMDIPLVPNHLTRDEIENRYPFSVIGLITTEDGTPLEGVSIQAYSGLATLFKTSSTKTDAAGVYKLRFMPGFAFAGHRWGAGKLSVKISASKGGLSGGASLTVSDRLIEGKSNVVLPNTPYQLDITLLPTD